MFNRKIEKFRGKNLVVGAQNSDKINFSFASKAIDCQVLRPSDDYYTINLSGTADLVMNFLKINVIGLNYKFKSIIFERTTELYSSKKIINAIYNAIELLDTDGTICVWGYNREINDKLSEFLQKFFTDQLIITYGLFEHKILLLSRQAIEVDKLCPYTAYILNGVRKSDEIKEEHIKSNEGMNCYTPF